MSLAPDPADSISPDDQLPPVEPPSAGFIVQLFIIPAMIVIIMFVVVAGIKWLVEQEQDPRAYVAALEHDNEARRWQAAHDLADLLRNPRNPALKRDASLARDLARVLISEIDEGRLDDKPLQLRVYLCHALGEFQVPDVVDPLLRAATVERAAGEAQVRFAALKGLAVYLSNPSIESSALDRHPRLLAVLLEASRDEQPLIRSTAAFALAAVSSEKATARLKSMLLDGYPNVRYNAATMLARQGDDAAVDVLAEMLDPEQFDQAVVDWDAEGDDAYRRDLIAINALRATSALAARNPSADLGPLRQATERLSRASVPNGVRLQADELLIELDKRSSRSTTKNPPGSPRS